MAILCGLDFSKPSEQALLAAGHLAKRMRQPLHLVHACIAASASGRSEPDDDTLREAELKLQEAARRLDGVAGEIHTHVRWGHPDEALLEVARQVSATLIIIAALGHRRSEKWQLGSHADRLAQRSHLPLLVVRSAAPFIAWANGERPLRVLLGVDPSLTAREAIRHAGELSSFGPCELTALHLYWPPAEFARLGLHGVRDYADPDPAVTRALTQELNAQLASTFDGKAVRVLLEPHIGRIGDRIASLADVGCSDLIVVGSHSRDAVNRALSGSTSRDVLERARVAVLCVPVSASANVTRLSEFRNVLIATDFSAEGNAAIALGYSAVVPGGTVHLVHVEHESPHSAIEPHDIFPVAGEATARSSERERLTRLIPEEAATKGVVTLVHVLESDAAADAICQAAERLGADAICLGTHAHGALGRVLPSVVQSVLHATRRPLLLAHAPLL
jgi:nucleotide-binding universal stress UspA family protein